jgi:nucleotide-binding universal stress UspA family protein
VKAGIYDDFFLQVSDVVFELVEGDARNVLCEAVDKHNASILVVGSHGYGAIKRS